jgi:uncharacterized FlgJ-related protein
LILNLLHNKNNIQSQIVGSNAAAATSLDQQNNAIISQFQQIIREQDCKIKQEHQEITKLIEQICFDQYPSWDTWWIAKLHNKYSVGATGHLLEDGHQAVADYILQHDSN